MELKRKKGMELSTTHEKVPKKKGDEKEKEKEKEKRMLDICEEVERGG